MKKELAKPQFNSTVLVQEIVNILKNPPFNENLTLMGFDEKKEFELLELIMRVLSMIDNDLKLSKNDNETMVLKKILDFLKVVNFPYSNEKQLEEDLNKADKKLLIQIIHFTLTKLNELKKKYYLSKFLNNVAIPDELTGDEEIIELMNQYRELQSEFQANYQMAEEKRQTKPQLKDLKDGIKKLQTDKLHLNNNIQNFKKQYSNKNDFLALLDSTSRLRKEQEEDSNLEKRIAKQQYELEENENMLMFAKQRAFELQNSLKDDISALDMLENLKNQRDKNKEIVDNLTKFEIVDKKLKLRALEEILVMPEVSFDMLSASRAEKKRIEQEIEKLEVKEKLNSSKSNEVSIYKTNALNASKAKEQVQKSLENLEKEKIIMENKINDLEKKFENTYGHRYIRKDDLIQQVDSIKKKKETYNKLNKIIENIKTDCLLLERTINIIRMKVPDAEEIVNKIKQKYGFMSYGNSKKELEELAKKKKDIDQSKEITLEEYTKLIQELNKKIEQAESLYAPLIHQQENVKKEYESLQPEYNKKKNNYDNLMQDTIKTFNLTKDEYNKLEQDFAKYQNDYHNYNNQISILEDQIKRYDQENLFNKDKRLSNEFKTYSDYYREIMNYQGTNIKELDIKKNEVRDNSQDNFRQIKYFNDLKKLLMIKKGSLFGK